jgi:hypothetical protein
MPSLRHSSVLNVDVSHKLSDRLVRRELHSDFFTGTPQFAISVPDSMRSKARDLRSFADALPPSRVGGPGHWPLWSKDGPVERTF